MELSLKKKKKGGGRGAFRVSNSTNDQPQACARALCLVPAAIADSTSEGLEAQELQ